MRKYATLFGQTVAGDAHPDDAVLRSRTEKYFDAMVAYPAVAFTLRSALNARVLHAAVSFSLSDGPSGGQQKGACLLDGEWSEV